MVALAAVAVAFLQGGIASMLDAPQLRSLGRLFYEPLWVFHRGDAAVDRLSELTAKRILVGPAGSGTNRLAIKLHEDQMSIEDLHDHIVGAGARIRMFQPEAMDMETAFMKLTEGKTA